jgi:hypothetical protein
MHYTSRYTQGTSANSRETLRKFGVPDIICLNNVTMKRLDLPWDGVTGYNILEENKTHL